MIGTIALVNLHRLLQLQMIVVLLALVLGNLLLMRLIEDLGL